MKQRHLFSLLDDSYITIKVRFLKSQGPNEPEAPAPARPRLRQNEELVSEQLYTYKALKVTGVKVGDSVVVDSPSKGLCVVPVVEVHDTPQIDLDAPFEYKWIVQKVDRAEYDSLVDKERQFGQMMLEVERTRQREALLVDLRAHLPEGSQARKLFDNATQLITITAPSTDAPVQ